MGRFNYGELLRVCLCLCCVLVLGIVFEVLLCVNAVSKDCGWCSADIVFYIELYLVVYVSFVH